MIHKCVVQVSVLCQSTALCYRDDRESSFVLEGAESAPYAQQWPRAFKTQMHAIIGVSFAVLPFGKHVLPDVNQETIIIFHKHS